MEWQQLEYFQAVAEVEHFTRAAERLSVAQPTLSRSIAKLEEELGVPLFERRGRRVALNAYGEMFYQRTIRVLQEIEAAKRDIECLLDPDSGHISIAFLKSLGASSVPVLVGDFLKRYPNVKFQLFQNSTTVMLDQLEAGEIDLCISSITESRPAVAWSPLWKEEIFVYVPGDHRLARRTSVRIDELAEEPFTLIKKGYGIRTIFDQLFEQLNIRPRILFEGEDLVTIMGFVSNNLGITLLPMIKGVEMTNVTCLKISDPVCERTIGLAWSKHRHLSPVIRRFQRFLSDYPYAGP